MNMTLSLEERKNKIYKFLSFLKENKDDIAVMELNEIFEEIIKEQKHFVDKFEIKEIIIEMKEGFKRMDQRFQDLIREMNARFETQDKRFEAIDKRFEDLIREMNARFETQDKRFQDLIREMNARFEFINKKINFLTWLLPFILTIFFGLTATMNYVSLNYQKEILEVIKHNISIEKNNLK